MNAENNSFWTSHLRSQAEGRMYRGLPKFDNPPPPPVRRIVNLKVDEAVAALEKLAEQFIQMNKAMKRASLKRRLVITEVPWLKSVDLVMSKGQVMVTGDGQK